MDAVGLSVPLHVEVSGSLLDPVRRLDELISDIRVDNQCKTQGYRVPQELVNDALKQNANIVYSDEH